MSSRRNAGSRDILEVGLDAFEEALGATGSSDQVDWALEQVFEKEFQPHVVQETREAAKLYHKVEISLGRFAAAAGAEEGKPLYAKLVQSWTMLGEGVSDASGLGGIFLNFEL